MLISAIGIAIVFPFVKKFASSKQEQTAQIWEMAKYKKVELMRQDLCDIRADNMLMKLGGIDSKDWTEFARQHYGTVETCKSAGATAVADALVIMMKPLNGGKLGSEEKERISALLAGARKILNMYP